MDLGSGFILKDLFLGPRFTCVCNTEGRVKCFGESHGHLSNGIDFANPNSIYIGDEPNEMGNYLDYVDLGTDFKVSHFSKGGGGAPQHVCVVSTENKVRCWGRNDFGQLGVGDRFTRGDASWQMGDNLPFVDLQIADPVSSECPSAGMNGVNWDDFVCCTFIVSSSLIPMHSHSVSTVLSLAS